MTRKEFTQMLLDNHISSVAIIRIPDYCGGHKFNALLNISREEVDEWLQNQDFTYLEWYGDASDAAKNKNLAFWSHVERFYEEPMDYPYILEELIIEALS
jgi:hypothetical protein